jgi:Cytochrome c oxidase caa3 assembly factor (Caa3_CtaG)
VTLVAAGGGLWLGLLRSAPQSRLPGLQRAVIAALAMWCTWITAFALGFSTSPVVHGYAGGAGLGAVADQEIAVGLVWGMAGLCFVPVIYAGMLSWLREAGDSRTGSGLPPNGAGARVRGWDRPPRGRGDSPARR